MSQNGLEAAVERCVGRLKQLGHVAVSDYRHTIHVALWLAKLLRQRRYAYATMHNISNRDCYGRRVEVTANKVAHV